MTTEEQRRRWRVNKQRYRDRLRYVEVPKVVRIYCAERVQRRGDAETFAREQPDGTWRCCCCGEKVSVVW